MVTRESNLITPVARYRLANALIWVGVLTWVPFILLRFAGEKPNIFLFLPFPLLGVVGGSRLKAAARRDLGGDAPRKTRLRTLGHILVFTGSQIGYGLIRIAQLPVDVGQGALDKIAKRCRRRLGRWLGYRFNFRQEVLQLRYRQIVHEFLPISSAMAAISLVARTAVALASKLRLAEIMFTISSTTLTLGRRI